MNKDCTSAELEDLLNDTNYKFSDHYMYRSVLGRGGFGVVVDAVSKSTLEEMAVKIILKKRIQSDEIEKIKGEADMLNSLDHPHIVKLKHMHESANKLYLAMEKMNGGSLYDLVAQVREKGTKLRDYESSQIIKGILEATAYLHELDIAHRDLKPANVMFLKEGDVTSLKLVDFGLSARYNRRQAISLTDKCGTMTYMAPEVYTHYQYSKVNLLGLLWRIVCRYMEHWDNHVCAPNSHPLYTKGERVEKYVVKLNSPKWIFPPSFSFLARSLFLKLVKVNPLERYAAKEALQHPWIMRTVAPIPLTFVDAASYDRSKDKLLKALFAVFFVGTLQEPHEDKEYDKKIERISDNVSEWHKSNQITTELKSRTDSEIYEKLIQSPIIDTDRPNEMIKVMLFGSFAESSAGSSPNAKRDENDSKSTGSSRSNSPTSGYYLAKKTQRHTIIDATGAHKKKTVESLFRKVSAKNSAVRGSVYTSERCKANSCAPIKRKFTLPDGCTANFRRSSLVASRRSTSRNINRVNVLSENWRYGSIKGRCNEVEENFTNCAKNTLALNKYGSPKKSGIYEMDGKRKAGLGYDALLRGKKKSDFALPPIGPKRGSPVKREYSPQSIKMRLASPMKK